MKSRTLLSAALISAGIMTGCAAAESAVSKKGVPKTAAQREAEEFKTLMIQDSLTRKERAAEALNILLSENDSDLVSVSIKNESACDIIVRLSGRESRNLPVRKLKSNHIVLQKGNYFMTANLCHSKWSSTKNFWDSVTLTLSEKAP